MCNRQACLPHFSSDSWPAHLFYTWALHAHCRCSPACVCQVCSSWFLQHLHRTINFPSKQMQVPEIVQEHSDNHVFCWHKKTVVVWSKREIPFNGEHLQLLCLQEPHGIGLSAKDQKCHPKAAQTLFAEPVPWIPSHDGVFQPEQAVLFPLKELNPWGDLG